MHSGGWVRSPVDSSEWQQCSQWQLANIPFPQHRLALPGICHFLRQALQCSHQDIQYPSNKTRLHLSYSELDSVVHNQGLITATPPVNQSRILPRAHTSTAPTSYSFSNLDNTTLTAASSPSPVLKDISEQVQQCLIRVFSHPGMQHIHDRDSELI